MKNEQTQKGRKGTALLLVLGRVALETVKEGRTLMRAYGI
jgi:hypothetical protein